MALLWGDSSKGRELTLLRRRVETLEKQVQVLARFTGIDPAHLPATRETLGEEAQRLALRGHKIAAVKAHRAEQQGLDLGTAVRDVEAFIAAQEHV